MSAPDDAPEFPHGERVAGGAYEITEKLQGLGIQQLWLARRVSDGAEALVAIDGRSSKQSVDDARQALGYAIPGGFELVHVGLVDRPARRREHDALVEGSWLCVEAVTPGTWLPRLLPAQHDPATAPRRAIELGLSAGRLLAQAAAAGRLLVRVRPEYLWAVHREGWQVTGLTDRPEALFARKRYELPTHPVFDRHYHAPEHHREPSERSLVFTLAVMIAEWAMGRYPFPTLFHGRGLDQADHVPIEAPEPLASLLARSIRLDPDERPGLDTFLDALARL